MAQGLEYSGTPTTFHGYERAHARHRQGHRDLRRRHRRDAGARGRRRRRRARPHAVLRRERRPGRRHRRAAQRAARFLVEDTLKVQADVYGHHGRVVEGAIAVGDTLNARVDADKRARTMRNHSATHLMHKALREVLGGHVQQKGSLVDAERTRFDFAHNAPMTDAQIRNVEAIVNAEILANVPTQARVMPIEEAQRTGAMMLFGEKYGDEVRVLEIGTSRELCGGTHVQRTGDIGLFKVVAEGGVAAGVRRIEAVTGDNALAYVQSLESTVNRVAGALKASPAELQARVPAVLDQVRALEKELARSRASSRRRRATSCWRRRSTCAASRCWRPCSTAPTPRRCARRWTSSRTS
jgi:alanyl-tRNA synthetase